MYCESTSNALRLASVSGRSTVPSESTEIEDLPPYGRTIADYEMVIVEPAADIVEAERRGIAE